MTDKFTVDFIDEEDGSTTMKVDWDETEPSLQWWTDLTDEQRKACIIGVLADLKEDDGNE